MFIVVYLCLYLLFFLASHMFIENVCLANA